MAKPSYAYAWEWMNGVIPVESVKRDPEDVIKFPDPSHKHYGQIIRVEIRKQPNQRRFKARQAIGTQGEGKHAD